MICSSCGAQHADESAACPECGAASTGAGAGAGTPGFGAAAPGRLEVTLDDLREEPPPPRVAPTPPPPAPPPPAPPSQPRYAPPVKASPPLPGIGPQVMPSFQPIPVYNVGPPRNNGMAIASMVTGLASLIFCYFAIVPAIVAVVLGAVAVKQIRESQGTQTGHGMAVAGIVLGSIWIGITVIGIIAIAASS